MFRNFPANVLVKRKRRFKINIFILRNEKLTNYFFYIRLVLPFANKALYIGNVIGQITEVNRVLITPS